MSLALPRQISCFWSASQMSTINAPRMYEVTVVVAAQTNTFLIESSFGELVNRRRIDVAPAARNDPSRRSAARAPRPTSARRSTGPGLGRGRGQAPLAAPQHGAEEQQERQRGDERPPTSASVPCAAQEESASAPAEPALIARARERAARGARAVRAQ